MLFSRTLPLIRYELTDSVRLATGQCTCGLPFALLESVEGRSEDTITLAGRDGPVRVHPNVFHAALETFAPNGWQVEQQPKGLVVRLVEPADAAQARDKVRQALVDLAVPCRWWMSSWWPPCTGPGWERSGSSRRCPDPPMCRASPRARPQPPAHRPGPHGVSPICGSGATSSGRRGRWS